MNVKSWKRRRSRPLRAAVGALIFVTLVGCGGGGGGSAGNDQPPSAPQGPTTSGLVPTAPALGDVLTSDAATLRPLADGATWRYHGQLRRLPLDEPVLTYDNRVRQLANGSAFNEVASNFANEGEQTEEIRLTAGRIETPIVLELPGRAAESFAGVELRSPVRAGDQYVIVDRRFDGIADLDADGRADAVDVGVYVRVIGWETVVLPTLPAVRAVRVEFTGRSRARYSRDGSVSAITDTLARVWYGPGLGIVRQQFETDSDVYGSRIVHEEWLLAHERPGRALGPGGAVAVLDAAVPLDLPGRRPEHVFVWGRQSLIADTTDVFAVQLTALNDEGRVLARQPLVSGRGQFFVRGDDGVAVLQQTTSGADAAFRLWTLDRLGTPSGPVAGVEFSLLDGRALITIGSVTGRTLAGSNLWVSYGVRPIGGSSRQVLRAVDARTGAFASAEIGFDQGGEPASNLLAAGGVVRQLQSRQEGDGSFSLGLLSMPIAPLGTPQWQTLASGLSEQPRGLEMHALDDGGMVLLWRGRMQCLCASTLAPGGVRIRADGSFVRSAGTASLADETIAALNSEYSFDSVRGQRLWFTTGRSTGFLPGADAPGGGYAEFLAFDLAPDTVLASAEPKLMRTRSDHLRQDADGFVGQWILSFEDRILWSGSLSSDPGVQPWYARPVHVPPGD